jgi:hypothetical protein
MTTLSQKSFSGGELVPSLYANTGLAKYSTAARTIRNFIVLRHGGVSNRPGTTFVCEAKYPSRAVRLLEFEFSVDQTYEIEFGHEYLRFIRNGSQLRLSGLNITGITQANPAVVTSNAHGLSNGDEVYISGVAGMTQVNQRNFKVAGVTANTFQLKAMDGTTNINSTSFTAYSSGGTAEKVYEISSPYQEDELFEVNFVQSADVITLVHPNHKPMDLTRSGHTSWTLEDVSFLPEISHPTGLGASAGAAGSNTYRYYVTAIDEETFEESLPGTNSTTKNITGITQANPAVVTSAAHGFANGDEVMIKSVAGMEEVNGRIFTIANVAANTFELEGVDSTGYGAYSSGGTANLALVKLASAAAPTASAPHTVTWTKVSGAREYNIYREVNGLAGLVGIAVGGSFSDIGLTPDTATTPPTSRNPFIGTGNYPSAVTYIQQRRVFAATDDNPEKIYMSRTGIFTNFTTSSPLQSDDAITFNVTGAKVNRIKHMIDLGRLVALTTGGEWTATSNSDGPLTPTSPPDLNQNTAYGSGNLRPLMIGSSAIFQQARGSIVRDIGFDYQVEGYSGSDLTIFSAHLFDGYTVLDWDYQQTPHSIVWAVRDDGTLLGMTYIREQQMIAWHRHDFENGVVESVSVIPEGNEDVAYLVIKRTINGEERRYIEKFTSRSIIDVIDLKLLDSNLSYDGRNTDDSHTMTLSGGTTWEHHESLTLTSSASFFTSSDVGNAIHIYSPSGDIIRCRIVGYTSATVVTVKPNKTVPANMRSSALNEWDRAVDQLTGLWHLEGENVSVFADGYVVASPNNESYDTITVENGSITLDRPYGVIHVGLPITSDIETLDVDTNNGETLANKAKIVQAVTMYVESSRGIWAGPKPPESNDLNENDDPLFGLKELKIREAESYDSPVELVTEQVTVAIEGEWNSNGRVFIRQVDPIPLTILSISPSGKFPFR